MAQSFEIFRLRTEVRSRAGSTFSDSLELTGEAQRRFQEILSAFGKPGWVFMIGLNKRFNELGMLPWAIIAFEKHYHLRGYVTATRPSKDDLISGPYEWPKDYSVEKHGILPISVLLIRNKKTFEQLDFQSPLYASFHDLLADKDPDQYWICFPDPLPEDWVRERESEDQALFDWFTGQNQTG